MEPEGLGEMAGASNECGGSTGFLCVFLLGMCEWVLCPGLLCRGRRENKTSVQGNVISHRPEEDSVLERQTEMARVGELVVSFLPTLLLFLDVSSSASAFTQKGHIHNPEDKAS